MGVLKVMNGAAASVVEPVLDCDNPRKRIRMEQDTSRNGLFLNNSINNQTSSAGDKLDDDHHFLLSLHPYMAELNASQKLRVRMKIQKLVFKELYKEDYDDDK